MSVALLVLVGATTALAQVDVLREAGPSPTAASLGKYGDVQVGLHSGAARFQVPIGKAQGRRLSVPLSLSYHASGIRVASIPGWVGAGWSLNAGGVVTRSVRGVPDDNPDDGYLATARSTVYDSTAWSALRGSDDSELRQQLIEQAHQRDIDLQPDVFTYNVGGRSGQFILYLDDNDNVRARTRDGSNVKIKPGPVGDNLDLYTDLGGNSSVYGFESFEIITPDGTIYEFGQVDGTPGHAIEFGSKGVTGSTCEKDCAWPTSWFLKRITDVSGTDEIIFTYDTQATYTYSLRPHVEKRQLLPGGECTAFEVAGTDHATAVNQVEARYVSKIESARSVVEFHATPRTGYAMEDEMKLDSIEVFNRGPQGAIHDKTVHLKYRPSPRLLLTSAHTYGRNGVTSAATNEERETKPPYEFDYYRASYLPPFDSPNVDHWGYYNAAGNNEYEVPKARVANIVTGQWTILPGNNREPNLRAARKGALRTIHYPTGGSSTVDYELHDVSEYLIGNVNVADIGTPVENSVTTWATATRDAEDRVNTQTFEVRDDAKDGDISVHVRVKIDTVSTVYGPGLPYEEAPIDSGSRGDDNSGQSSATDGNICTGLTNIESYAEIVDSTGAVVHTFNCTNTGEDTFTDNVALAPGTYTLRATAGDDRPDDPWYTWVGVTWYNIVVGGEERRPVGGLRVKKTTTRTGGDGAPTVKRYVYEDPSDPGASSGYAMRRPQYHNVTQFPYVYEKTGNSGLCGNATRDYCKYVTRSTSSITSLGSVSGGSVGYRYVTVLNGADSTRGWTQHHFATEREGPAIANAALIPPAQSSTTDGGRYFGTDDTGQYSKLPHRAGFKKMVRQFDASGRLLAKTENQRDIGGSLIGVENPLAVQQPAVDIEFWQPQMKEGHALLNTTIDGLGGNGCNSQAPIFGNMSFYYVIGEWVRPTNVRKTSYDPDSGNQTWTEKTMTYGADSSDYNGLDYLGGRQPRTVTTTTSEGHVQETTHLYIEDDESSPWQAPGALNHLIAPKVRTTVRDGNGNVVSQQWMRYKLNSTAPREKWVWRGDGSGTDTTAPDFPSLSNAETVRTMRVAAYDAYIQPTAVVNARGDTTFMTYNAATGDLQPSVQLHSVRKGGLTVDYYYDAYGKANEIVDENGHSSYFNYDAAGRLVSVQDARGDTTTIHEYDFARRFVRKTLPGGSMSPDQIQTTYVDGLGRTQQVHTLLRPGATQVSVTEYDELGRPYKKYQPYLYYGRGFDGNVDESVFDFHGSDKAYTRTTYVDDPFGKADRVYRPGRDGTSNFAQSRYGIRTVEEDGVTSGPFQFSASFDESGIGGATFNDALGRKKAVVAGIDASLPDSGTVSGTVTQFEYDGISKQIAAVIKPEGDRVEFVYDRIGSLLERRSPDSGTSRSRYTKPGQVRFSQNANQRVRGLVAFSHYDTFGRPITSGVVESDLASLDPDQTYAFDTDPNAQGAEWRSVMAYDQAPDFSTYPWNQVGASGLTLQNGKGRMVAQAVRVTPPETMTVTGGETIEGTRLESAQTTLTAGPATVANGASLTMEAGQSVTLQPGFTVESGAAFSAQTDSALDTSDPDWRFTFVSYDDLGRIETKVLFAPGAPGGGQQTFTYDYDRQGRMTYRRVDAGGSTLHTRYEYNAAGLVQAVYASETDPTPDVPEVKYTYTANGQIERVLYRSIQPIERDYNVRGELTAIGDIETGEAAFNAAYHYGVDGSIQEIEVHQPAFNGNHRFRRTFSYDNLDRLIGANYSAHDGSGYKTTTLYDVRNVQYDENGNILALERRGETGAKVDELSYTYNPSRPNRLQSVSDAIAPTAFDWDAEDGGFTYDASGNATTLPAPHGATNVAYDEANLPIRMETPEGLSRYRYSGDGQRTYVRRPDGTVEHHVREGSALVGRFANGQLRHWNVLLPSGTVIGRLPQ